MNFEQERKDMESQIRAKAIELMSNNEVEKLKRSEEIDAILISCISDRKHFSFIDPVDLGLRLNTSVGNISQMMLKNKDCKLYLSPLFLHLTALARKANVNLGSVIEEITSEHKDNFMKGNNAKNALCMLNFWIFNLVGSANDLSKDDLSKLFNKEQLEAIQKQAIDATFNAVLCLNLIADATGSSIRKVQSQCLYHVRQLSKLI